MDNEQTITFYSVTEYIKENFIGLLMLIFVFFIVYFIDYINRLNSLSTLPIPTPGYPNTLPINMTKMLSKRKKHKKG
jgi:hypothetical protein